MDEIESRLSEERLALYVDGALGSDERLQVEQALDRDPRWLAVVANLARDRDSSARPGVCDAERPLEALRRLRPGTRLGRYELEGVIGRGGMGVVYRARDPQLGRRIAIKLLASTDTRHQTRLLTEARILARLNDRRIITIHDVGRFGDRVFVATELLEGNTLRAWRSKGRPSIGEVLDVFIEAGRALQVAHAADVVHRDFKPANVMLTLDGRVVVLDFGLSRASSPGAVSESGVKVGDTEDPTQTGACVGTPAYMAPEQRSGERVGPAADQYSFCVALWEALLGHRPGDAAVATFEPVRGRIPRTISKLLLRGLERDPAKRHASMQNLVDALERIRGPRRWPVGVGLGVLSAGAVWVASGKGVREDPCAEPPVAFARVWNPDRRDAVDSALQRASLPSSVIRQRSLERLGTFASMWIEQYRDACRRGMDDEPLMSCLDRRLREFDTALAILSEADPQMAMNAITGVECVYRPIVITKIAAS